VAALSAQQLLTSLRVADPGGQRVVPTLLRRLAVVSHRYVQQRKANAALASETYLHRTRIRLLEKDCRALAAAVSGSSGAAGAAGAAALAAAHSTQAVLGGVLGEGRRGGGGASSSLDAASTSRALRLM
jgi:hypothetical protein